MRWTRTRSRPVVPTSGSKHGRAVRPHLEELEGRVNPSVVTATQSGLWSAASTWGGLAPPGAADTALIGSGISVTLNANPTVAGMTCTSMPRSAIIRGVFALMPRSMAATVPARRGFSKCASLAASAARLRACISASFAMRSSTGSSSQTPRLATAAAQHTGLAVKLDEWNKVRDRSSE